MIKLIKVQGNFKFKKYVEVEFGDIIEIHLDCFLCERINQPIAMKKGLDHSVCSTTKHLFPGKILKKDKEANGRLITITYKVEYWYAPFKDKEDQSNAICSHPWGRIFFDVVCPNCRKIAKLFTQTDTQRPCNYHCDCGELLCVEKEPNPIIGSIETLP